MPTDQVFSQDAQSDAHERIQPLNFSDYNYVPGKKAPWYCSPEPVYGPNELGEYANYIDQLSKGVNKAEMAARTWEVLQSWESRLFRRNYQFLNAGHKGLSMFGGSAGMSGASIFQTQNTMKLFSCNVYGTRGKKIAALLSREIPSVDIGPEHDDDQNDEAAADEAERYAGMFTNEAKFKKVIEKAAGYFWTDDRVGFLTYTIADATKWGYERQEYDEDGNPIQNGKDIPKRKEVTRVFGKLETKVPILADEEEDFGWCRFQWEEDKSRLKAMYPWIADKITSSATADSAEQIDRMARINVRLAVQASSTSSDAFNPEATHTVTFFEPCQYEAIDDEARDIFYELFPDGMEVWYAGGVLAMVRNCRSANHKKFIHPAPGDGQNRESIGTNYLPLQKILNANISLLDRYFRSSIPRRFVGEPYIDSQTMNSQSNDPARATAVDVKGLADAGLKISDITGVENVPQPNDSIFGFIQWLIAGGPEAMDGGTPAAFGEAEANTADQGVYQTQKLKRDQALQVFGPAWAALCEATACIIKQAFDCASENRLADISASLPGKRRLQVNIGKMRGSITVQPETLEIPHTLAEQEEQMQGLVADSANVALYQQIMLDPRNLEVFSKFPSLKKLNVPGVDQVEQQQSEFEKLMESGPIDNPQLAAITDQINAAANDPEAQTPQGQQVLAQLQQAAKMLPPKISTVPVAQDTSENHAIHAAVTLGFLTGAMGRKLKNGTPEQQQIWLNFKLHWQAHMQMLKNLQEPPQVPMKASVTVDPTKLPPAAQAKAFQALGLAVNEADVTPQNLDHELTEEREGLDENGVPVKQKISVVGKPLS